MLLVNIYFKILKYRKISDPIKKAEKYPKIHYLHMKHLFNGYSICGGGMLIIIIIVLVIIIAGVAVAAGGGGGGGAEEKPKDEVAEDEEAPPQMKSTE